MRPAGDEISCVICSAARGRPDDVVSELSASWVTAAADAPLPGYACVVAKTHAVEPYELGADERAAFWEDCLLVSRALADLFKPSKMNYEIHGNTIPHLHMHLYPRYPGDPYKGAAIDGRARFDRTPSDIAAIRRAVESAVSLARDDSPGDRQG
ncbi:MAG: HIT family protein [Candidatus Dormibacteraeota bacterium]|nr:HIT family protein [Candidatus Dormibacteraeota bacterium]